MESWLTAEAVTAFSLALARTGAWVMAAPAFGSRGVSGVGRLAVAVALALATAPLLPVEDLPQGSTEFVTAAVAQVAVGLVLGMLTSLLFSAFEVAGTLADLTSGFSFASVLDPLSGQPAAAFSRMFALAFSAVFFATDVHLMVIGGVVRSFEALPADALPALSEATPAALGGAATQMMAAALQVAAPLLGVLFLTDVALGLATRFVPQANALSLALPVKTMVALLAAGSTLALLPAHVLGLVEPAVELPFAVLE